MTKNILKKTLILTSIFAATAQVSAGGFQLNAQSATGLGRAFAGDAVIADNASVMASNAAAMTLFDKTAISLGVTTVDSKIKISDATYTIDIFKIDKTTPADVNNAGGFSAIPNIHLIVPMNNKLSLGFDAYTNFGAKTKFDDNYPADEYGGLTDLKTTNFGLATAYRINQQWSIGGGLDIIYATGKLQRTAFINESGVEGKVPLIDIDAKGWGIGFNLGSVYELNKNNRFGLAYHYSPKITATGNFKGFSPAMINADELYIPLPSILELSGYHKIESTKFALHYSVEWTGWSAFDSLNTDKGQVKDYQWKDTYHFAIGSTYYLNNNWTLRSGYMYDLGAQDKLTSISVPDSDRQWLSAGVTYHLNQKSTIDFGATYLLGQDTKVNEETIFIPGYMNSKISGTTHTDAILLGLQYSMSF